MELIDQIINEAIISMGLYGPLLGCFLILIESIFPFLPLFVFISLNFIVFGNLLGLIISWIFTVLGCILSFYLFRNKVKTKFDIKYSDKKAINNLMNKIDKMKFNTLVFILANPFLPAFINNIAAGLSKMSFKKYLAALLIGKLFMVYFWGYIGTSLLQSLTDINIFIRTITILLLAYLLATIINKKYKLD